MSNTQFAFIKKDKVPNREALQSSIQKLGFNLELDPDFTPFEDEGFSPCILNGEENIGFEIYYETVKDITEDDGELKKIAIDKDYCISMSWGGRMKDCASVMIVSSALAKDYDAIISYEGDAPETLDKIISDTALIIEDAILEDFEDLETKKAISDVREKGNLPEQIKNELKNLEQCHITGIVTGNGIIIYFSDKSYLKSMAYSYTNEYGEKFDASRYARLSAVQFSMYENCTEPHMPSEDETIKIDSMNEDIDLAQINDPLIGEKLKEDMKTWPEKLEVLKIEWEKQDTITLYFKNLNNVCIELYATDPWVHTITLLSKHIDYRITEEDCQVNG